jgi:hypothetical protein
MKCYLPILRNKREILEPEISFVENMHIETCDVD